MKDIYCAYFDHNYLSRATVMIESLRRFDPETQIYILALSDLCEDILHKLALPHIKVISLKTLEGAYPELAPIKAERTVIEYYFTLTPFLPHYLFAQTSADRITYIDADLYFFTSPKPLLASIENASVAITPHRFSHDYRNHTVYGRFNVAWITYRRSPEGLECVDTYKAECAEWCYDKLDGDRFGDQKYLDKWPDRYKSLNIIEHKGFNVAIWNVHGYVVRLKNNIVMVDNDPIVFYHFAGTQVTADGTVAIAANPRSGRSQTALLQHVIIPYKQRLELEIKSLRERFPALAKAKSGIRYAPSEHKVEG